MSNPLIIFNIPKTTPVKAISPFLTNENTIRGSDFLIVNAPIYITNKIKEEKCHEMMFLSDLENTSDSRILLKRIEYEKMNNEQFMVYSENTIQLFMNDFTGQLVIRAQFRGNVSISNTGVFIVHQNCMYSGNKWQLYAIIPSGKVSFSSDDMFMAISLDGTVNVYETKTMGFKEYDGKNVVFGDGIILIDDKIVELVGDSIRNYKELLADYNDDMNNKDNNDVSSEDVNVDDNNKNDSSDDLVTSWLDCDQDTESSPEKIYYTKIESHMINLSPYNSNFLTMTIFSTAIPQVLQ